MRRALCAVRLPIGAMPCAPSYRSFAPGSKAIRTTKTQRARRTHGSPPPTRHDHAPRPSDQPFNEYCEKVNGGMHLTPPDEGCSLGGWKITPGHSWNSRNDSLRRPPAFSTWCPFAGPMVFAVQNVSIMRHGRPNEGFFNARNVDIRLPSRQVPFSTTAENRCDCGLRLCGI
jgi:hypothetical protein